MKGSTSKGVEPLLCVAGSSLYWINPRVSTSTTMRRAAWTGDETRILVALLLRLIGDFLKILEPLRITPSQAGVLFSQVSA